MSSQAPALTGGVYRAAIPRRWGPDNETARYTLTVRTPVEVVLFELLIHEDVPEFGDPTLQVLGLLEDRPRGIGSTAHASELKSEVSAISLGRPATTHSARVSIASRLAPAALDRDGWGDLSAYRAFRAEMAYPIAPCELGLSCAIARNDS